MNRAYLLLGSNINPTYNLPQAVKLLADYCSLRASSTVWESAPVGLTAQPNFLNAALLVETELSAAQLKQAVLRRIEAQLGRVRQGDKDGPRPIDLDIVFFNDTSFDVEHELFSRPFVALPLAEIAPTYHHPDTGQSLQTIAAGFPLAATTLKPRPDVSTLLQQILADH